MYSLEGIDGNAFSVIGYVTNAMRQEGYDEKAVKAYERDAKSSDHAHLLRVSAAMVDELNGQDN